MANPLVLEMQKKAAEARSGGYLKLKDGETLLLTKLAESEVAVGQYGTQSVYAVEDEQGKRSRIAFKIGHPAVDSLEALKIGAKFKIKRTGSGQKDTRYTVTAV